MVAEYQNYLPRGKSAGGDVTRVMEWPHQCKPINNKVAAVSWSHSPTAYKSYNNCKWCTMVVCLADWVFLLVQLDSLALHENRLGGTLPASWSKLTSVSYEHCTILPCIAVAQVWTCVSNPMATGHAQLGCACFLLRKCAHVAQTSWLTAQTSGKPNALQWAHYSWHTKTMQASSGCLWYVIASFSASQD